MRVTDLAGLVLAAGAGRRFGGPKALATTERGEPWLRRAVQLLTDAGCSRVTVVLGAKADAARALAPADATVVVAEQWQEGMGASLAAGLRALESSAAIATLVTLVDLPDMPIAACSRLIADAVDARTLRQAVYDDVPGHPVLIGRAHWAPMRASVSGDRGGRAYLRANAVAEIECSDLWPGDDVDARPTSDLGQGCSSSLRES